MEEFELGCTLLEIMGEGAFGTVFRAIDDETGECVAVKGLAIEEKEEGGGSDGDGDGDGDDETGWEELQREVEILRSCGSTPSRHHSPFITTMLRSGVADLASQPDFRYWIVLELCNGGGLDAIVQHLGDGDDDERSAARPPPISEEAMRDVVASVLGALHYLHKYTQVIHRDVKCANVLVSTAGVAKLADFGISAQLAHRMSRRETRIGSPFWMAPEMIEAHKRGGYDNKVDVWALGVTCIEMAQGFPPHHDVGRVRATFRVVSKPPPTLARPERWSAECADFIAQCLVKEASDRRTAEQLTEHTFVSDAIDRLTAAAGRSPAIAELAAVGLALRQPVVVVAAATAAAATVGRGEERQTAQLQRPSAKERDVACAGCELC